MITVQLPRTRRRRQLAGRLVFGVGLVQGLPYRTPGDPPCVPGTIPLWPGGDCLPRWCELEMGLLSTARGDNLPPTPEQLACLVQLGRVRVPATRLEARALIRRTLEGETDDRWWEVA